MPIPPDLPLEEARRVLAGFGYTEDWTVDDLEALYKTLDGDQTMRFEQALLSIIAPEPHPDDDL